jgi:hypothetical protein
VSMIFMKMCKQQNLCQQERHWHAIFSFHVSRQFITKRSNFRVVDYWNHNGRTPLHLLPMQQALVGTTKIKQSSIINATNFPSLLHLWINDSQVQLSLSTIHGLWHKSNHPCES